MRTFYCLLSILLISLPLASDEIDWETNFEMALSKATKSGKSMVVLFTGSDWCASCKRLESDVFEIPAFVEQAKDQFVFLKLTFPRNSYRPKNQSDRSQLLSNQYLIRGFPTVLILDPTGKELARTGYQDGDPTAYAQHLLQLAAGNSSNNATETTAQL